MYSLRSFHILHSINPQCVISLIHSLFSFVTSCSFICPCVFLASATRLRGSFIYASLFDWFIRSSRNSYPFTFMLHHLFCYPLHCLCIQSHHLHCYSFVHSFIQSSIQSFNFSFPCAQLNQSYLFRLSVCRREMPRIIMVHIRVWWCSKVGFFFGFWQQTLTSHSA